MHNSSAENLEKLSDAALLDLFQEENDSVYLGELYRRYRHLAFGLSYRYFKNQHDSEDMVNYIFALLQEKLPGKEIRSFKQYLYGTVRNECLARTRQLKKEMERKQEWTNWKNSHSEFMEIDVPLNHTNENTVEEVVQEAVQQLGAEQKIYIRQFFFRRKKLQGNCRRNGLSAQEGQELPAEWKAESAQNAGKRAQRPL